MLNTTLKQAEQTAGIDVMVSGGARVAGIISHITTRTEQVDPHAVPATPADTRAILIEAFLLWLVTRLGYVAYTYYAMLFSAGGRVLPKQPVSVHTLIAAWQHWDAIWYLRIAREGYAAPRSTAFFPLYPSLVHVFAATVGMTHELVIGLVIANLGALGAFIAMGLLAVDVAGSAQASAQAIRVLVAYPLSFFMAAPYTESLFIALAAATLLAARRGSWRWCSVWSFLAAATRPTSVALFLPVIWEYGRQHEWWSRAFWREGRWRTYLRPRYVVEGALVGSAIPAAFAAYAIYCWIRFGHPKYFINAQHLYWGHVMMPPWQAVALEVTRILQTPGWTALQARLLFNFVPFVMFAVLTVFAVRRLPVMLTLYAVGTLYLAIAAPILTPDGWDVFTSVGRYMVIDIPIFLLLATLCKGRQWLDMLLVSAGFLLQALLLLVYLRNGYVL